MFWLEQNALLIGDLHFGKATHFRKNGIAINQQVALNDFIKLEKIIVETNPKTIYFVGDLFHSEVNSELELLKDVIEKFNEKDFILLKGNHDIIKKSFFENIRIQVLNQIQLGDFILSHEPILNNSNYNIYAHIHPGIMLKGKAKQTLKFPCFYFSSSYAVLPAFANFTGLKIMDYKKTDTVFIIANNVVVKI